MRNEKFNFENYYDGHYVDSGKSPEEREEAVKLALEENKKLKDWSDVKIND